LGSERRILSGLAILLTGFRFVDLIIGAAIGLYVVKEAVEIIGEARKAGGKTSQPNSSAYLHSTDRL
jgi:Co/Zn/Cd efflux system component